ncbi:MAG: DUF11 domain-containing protein [Spirulina sp.]
MFDPSKTPMPFFAQALWPLAKRLTSALVAALFVVTSLVGWAAPAQAQAGLAPFQAVTAINAPLQPTVPDGPTLTPYSAPCDIGGCAGNSVDLTFGTTGNRSLQTFTVPTLPPLVRATGITERVVFVRNPTLLIDGDANRQVVFFENAGTVGANPPTAINLAPERAEDIPSAFLSPVVNRGIDNVFNNVTGGNQDTRNNIERIDYILPDGVVVPPDLQAQEGFVVLERGGNDPFQIAAITSLNPDGTPATYGPLRTVGAGSWGGGGDIGVTLPTVVFRRNDGTNPANPFLPSHTVGDQSVRGIFFPINALLTAPQSNGRIFGYSLVANDVLPGTDLTQPETFPTATDGNVSGGLDLVAGGFGLFRVPRPPVPGNLFLNKRITQLTAAGTVIPFPGTETSTNPNDAGFPALVAAGLGQGTVTVTTPELQPGDTVDYALYFNNTGETAVSNVQICDQIPPGTSFSPDTFGAGFGVQAIPPSNSQNPPVNYPTVNYTGASDGDPATFLPPGAPLPALCGADRGNGALVVNVGTVGPSQVGVIRFRTSVNPIQP